MNRYIIYTVIDRKKATKDTYTFKRKASECKGRTKINVHISCLKRFPNKDSAYDYVRRIAKRDQLFVIEHPITGIVTIVRKSHKNLIRVD